MRIFNAASIAEYKAERDRRIQRWVDTHFAAGAVTWEMAGALHVKITDKKGDSMTIALAEID